jgi:hypothetical protein
MHSCQPHSGRQTLGVGQWEPSSDALIHLVARISRGKIHVGQCGVHAASLTLVGNAFREGFYWPTTKPDGADLV